MNLTGTAYLSLLLLLILVVAFLYASVGHGGASGYLAIMSAFSFPISFMKPTALILNILVAGVAFYFYQKEKTFKSSIFYPFAITSVPFSFIGGYININPYYFKILLGTILLFAVGRLIGLFGKQKEILQPIQLPLALLLGAIIGLLSGLLGIGGGIILSPLLLLLGWANFKQAATVSALFILVNSIAGLLGYLSKGASFQPESILFIITAVIGGTFGAYYGSKKFNTIALRNILALVLGIAIVKLYTTA